MPTYWVDIARISEKFERRLKLGLFFESPDVRA